MRGSAEGGAATETLTERQLVALFAAHCECRPLDIDRAEHEHSHDCDTGVLDDIQTALNATDPEEQGAAMFQCSTHWQSDHDSSVYRPLLLAALERPPMTIQEFNRRNS